MKPSVIASIVAAPLLFLAASVHADDTSDLLKRGEYLTRAADCEACHTVPGGTPFVGGRSFALPFGVIYSPNITPDTQTGIGSWTDDEFVRALHEGIGKDGEHLYPAFPYTSYTQMTREDALAIKDYLFSLHPIAKAPVPNTLAFPFNQRWGMAFWNALYLGKGPFLPDPQKSDDWNRGNYLANALGHCAECHTPRTISFGLDNSRAFGGSTIDGWRAYNLSSDKEHGLGAWSDEQIESYLSKGHAQDRGAAAGPMEEVVRLSLSHLTKDDVHALGVYLRSIPPQSSPADPVVNESPPALQNAAYVPSEDPGLGQRVFAGSCASCHGWDGSGMQTAYAALKGNSAVNDTSALNLVQIVLNGASVNAESGTMRMPAFARSLNNDEIAALANFVVGRFGGKDSRVTARDVSAMRDPAGQADITAYTKWIVPGMIGVALAVALGMLLLIVWRRNRVRSSPLAIAQ